MDLSFERMEVERIGERGGTRTLHSEWTQDIRFRFRKMHTLEWQEAEEWNTDDKIVWGQIMKVLNAKPGSLPLVLRTTASEHFKISNEAGILAKVIDINEKTGLQEKRHKWQNVQLGYNNLLWGNGGQWDWKGEETGDIVKEDMVLLKARPKTCFWDVLSSQMVILIETYHEWARTNVPCELTKCPSAWTLTNIGLAGVWKRLDLGREDVVWITALSGIS